MQYRKRVSGRFLTAELHYSHTNILIGWRGHELHPGSLLEGLQKRLENLYAALESYISLNPAFRTTLEPWPETSNIPFIDRMIQYADEAEVGPMAAVAGIFADELLDHALGDANTCSIESAEDAGGCHHECPAPAAGTTNMTGTDTPELFIENGGDVAIQTTKQVNAMIYPGYDGSHAALSLCLPPGRWGIASSSGVFGHSFSAGEAEMVTVVAEDAARADAFATAIANMIVPGSDPLGIIGRYEDLPAVTIVWRDRIWYSGCFELAFG